GGSGPGVICGFPLPCLRPSVPEMGEAGVGNQAFGRGSPVLFRSAAGGLSFRVALIDPPQAARPVDDTHRALPQLRGHELPALLACRKLEPSRLRFASWLVQLVTPKAWGVS